MSIGVRAQDAAPPGASAVADEALMLRAARDEPGAFEELVRRYRTGLYGYFARMVGNVTDAEDLFQETWLRVYRKRKEYAVKARFRTWLYTIATNLVRDEYRRRGRRRVVSLHQATHEDGRTLEETLVDEGPTAARLAGGQEALQRVKTAVARLPAEQREAVILAHFQHLGYAEVAEVLSCSVGTVKSRLFRARQHLDAMLGDLVGELGLAKEKVGSHDGA